jgi:uncharacterized protein YfcZ (UPF0381/DUF406 family)
MMTSVMENVEQPQRFYRTRAEAAQLLEELRALYRGLAPEERCQIKSQVAKLARLQAVMEEK